MSQPNDTGFTLKVNRKTVIGVFVALVSLLLSGSVGGTLGSNYLFSGNGGAWCETLAQDVKTVEREVDEVERGVSLNDQTIAVYFEQSKELKSRIIREAAENEKQEAKIHELEALIHNNAEQVNKLVGRMDAILSRGWND